MKHLRFFAVLSILFHAALSEEGMWTFDNPPRKQVKEQYGFEVTQEWLDHVRLSTVRFNNGGSGSFVSPNGLVMTNHHVSIDQIEELSTSKRDFVKNGFYAATNADELPCSDLELNVLVEMENVTDKILSVSKPGMNEKEIMDARKRRIAELTNDSSDHTGFRTEVVAFYNENEFWLYRYKKFTDVRLVMSPEEQIANFGGDLDNFTYPRYDLDMAFFRVYENGKPYVPTHFLRWKTEGAKENELVFVSGHPGLTDRQRTAAQLQYMHDYSLPAQLKKIQRQLSVLRRYAATGSEERRRAQTTILRLENELKALTGEYEGLQESDLMTKKKKEEEELRAKVSASEELNRRYGWAWDSVAVSLERSKKIFKKLTYRHLIGKLAAKVLAIVQYATEMKKPNEERDPRFQDANIEAVKFRIFSPAPIYPDLEKVQLTDRFAEALEMLGPNDPWVHTVLNGRTPEEAAEYYVTNTKLDNSSFRKALVDSGEHAIVRSNDPMIVMARRITLIQDSVRMENEKEVTSILLSAEEAIGKSRFAVYGKSLPPDATFTLRLSYGQIKGYPMNGTIAPSITTFYGLYDRSTSFPNRAEFDLPERYKNRAGMLTLSTPLNFVTTNDIVGGNSGSPVINKEAEVVGLIFDGNIESLTGRFSYLIEKNRAVAVHTGAIIETLRKLYDAGNLADEIEGVAAKPEPDKKSLLKQKKHSSKKKKKLQRQQP